MEKLNYPGNSFAKAWKKQMINWKPWSSPPDDCMRTKLQHVHHYDWKYLVVLLEFHKKSDLSHTYKYRYILHPLLCKRSWRLGLISKNSGFGPHQHVMKKPSLSSLSKIPPVRISHGNPHFKSWQYLQNLSGMYYMHLTRLTVFWNAVFITFLPYLKNAAYTAC